MPNKIIKLEDHAIMLFNNSYGKNKYTTIDLELVDEVSKYSWRLGRDGYVRTNVPDIIKKQRVVMLHHLVNGYPLFNFVTDHIDGNKLNNLRSNLRIVSNQQNIAKQKKRKDNTTGFRGVVRRGNRYIAQIKVNSKQIYLGYFNNKEEAAKAYDLAALNYFGEFSVTNF